jgi:hypothetical protein
LCPAGVWAASPLVEQAIQKYKARQYAAALAGFQSALKTSPTDPGIHYYMALCYLSMNQISLARQQYEWVVTNGTNRQLTAFASAGLAQLSKYQPTFGTNRPVTTAASGAGGGARRYQGRLKILEFYADW